MDTKVLIIGAGHAGIETAASLRNLGFSGKIVIFDQENTLPYQKPPLSKSYIKSFDTKEALLRSKEWYVNNKIDLKLNTNIKFINHKNKSLSDEKDNLYYYDKLVIATGSKNNLLGIDTKEYQKGNFFSLRNLEDSKRIRKKISEVQTITIIGAGFIGLEIATTALQLNKDVTIIENSENVMGRSISKDLSAWLINYYTKSGIKFIFNKSFKSFKSDENSKINVILSDGTKINSEMVLISAGSQPNDLLFKSIKVNEFNKIKVNSFLETNIDDIYAIGDCCFFDYYSKEVRLESIQNATDQAKTVAKNILGMKELYNFVPWFWSDQLNIKLQIVGLLDLNSNIETKIIGSQESSKFSNFIFADNQLQAVESINSPGHHLIMKNNWGKRHLLKKDHLTSDFNLKNFFNSLT